MYAPPHQQPRLQRSLSQKKRDQAAARKEYNNEWQTGLCNAPCASPGYCCYALFCPSCAAYSQRVLQMGAAWPSQYTCCNGMTCISGKCGERSNPELCLACEVCCCFPNAVVTTRFMVQDEQRVMNTQCDNCLIGFMLITQQLAACLRCIAIISQNPDIEQLADIVDCIADFTYATVCACMQTQQQVQIQYRDANRSGGMVYPGVMSAPTAPTMQAGMPSSRVTPSVLVMGGQQQPAPPPPPPTVVYVTAPPQQQPRRAAAQPTQGSTYYPPM